MKRFFISQNVTNYGLEHVKIWRLNSCDIAVVLRGLGNHWAIAEDVVDFYQWQVHRVCVSRAPAFYSFVISIVFLQTVTTFNKPTFCQTVIC